MERRRTRRCSLPLIVSPLPVTSAGPLARPAHVIWRSTSYRRATCVEEQLMVPTLAIRRRSPSKSKRVGSHLGHFSPPVTTGCSGFAFELTTPDDRPSSMNASYTVSWA
ncbi:unnamed protein product [Nippostrongylus brasiliensis]|uniref:Secreted protein n=1 Tax=Nippostrongylus brasiliensis TaxID=27835 RepID=A0A0N4Y518_NIPBR|nr:hypothetical protein Q1695_013102 [Nippostrongylus brasiliensis]VDL74640.1 unnamed protein product [Nippostrongylus brasiliensis]